MHCVLWKFVIVMPRSKFEDYVSSINDKLSLDKLEIHQKNYYMYNEPDSVFCG